MGDKVQTKTFNYIYARTNKGAMLRKYLVDMCALQLGNFRPEVLQENFPKKMLDEIVERRGNGVGEIDMEKYHIALDWGDG